jgi:hypothetical protein
MDVKNNPVENECDESVKTKAEFLSESKVLGF